MWFGDIVYLFCLDWKVKPVVFVVAKVSIIRRLLILVWRNIHLSSFWSQNKIGIVVMWESWSVSIYSFLSSLKRAEMSVVDGLLSTSSSVTHGCVLFLSYSAVLLNASLVALECQVLYSFHKARIFGANIKHSFCVKFLIGQIILFPSFLSFSLIFNNGLGVEAPWLLAFSVTNMAALLQQSLFYFCFHISSYRNSL